MKKLLCILLLSFALASCSKNNPEDEARLDQYKKDIVGYWVWLYQDIDGNKAFNGNDTTYTNEQTYHYYSEDGKYYDCGNWFLEITFEGKQVFDSNVRFNQNYHLFLNNSDIFLSVAGIVDKITFIEHDILDMESSSDNGCTIVDRYIRKDWVAPFFPIPE